MSIIVFLAVVVLVTVIPVMVAAKYLDARNSGFLSCVLAVVGSVSAEHIASMFISNPGFSALVAFVLTAVFYSVILGASFKNSVLIALLAIGVQFVVGYFLLGAGVATGVLTEGGA